MQQPSPEIESLRYLRDIVVSDIADLYQGIGAISDHACVKSLCDDITNVIDSFIEKPQSFDLSDDECMSFLTRTLPVLVEVFLRRKSRK